MFSHPYPRFSKSVSVAFLLALWFILPSAFPLPARGDEPKSTEEIGFVELEDVYAAAKHLQTVKEAPASITVVTADDISHYGYRTLTDVVDNVRSFYSYSDRNYEYIGVRGFARLGDYGNRVLQLVDGHAMNDNIYGTFYMGRAFGVDMDLIQKIEFIRGPGASLYGNNAVFGTVNIVTKKGKDLDGLYTKVEGGNYNTYSGTIAYGKKFGEKMDLLISAGFLNSKGQDLFYPEFALSSAVGGWARNADGEGARNFLIKASFGEVTFLANAVSRQKNVPSAAYETVFNNNQFKTVDEKFFAELKWDHAFDAGMNLQTKLFYDWYRFEGTYPYDIPAFYINKDKAEGQSIGAEVVCNQKISSHHLLAGADLVYSLQARQQNFDEFPRVYYLDDSRTFTNWSIYAQDEWDITSWLRFTGGLRLDHYSTFGYHLSPRAGLILNPFRSSTIKLLYGQAFRAPNVYELYYATTTDPSLYRANPGLKPEIIDTYEIVIEQEITPAVKLIGSGFHYTAKDLISQEMNPDGSFQFRNTSRVKSDGLELGCEINWPGIVKGEASYTYQNTIDEQTGQWLANSPRHMIKIGGRVPLYRNFVFWGGQVRYLGNRLNRDGEDVGDAFVVDMSLLLEYKKFSATASAFNLLDASYAVPVSGDHLQKSIFQNGRNFWFKIGYVF